MKLITLNMVIGMFTLRVLLALIFLMQGFGKVYSFGVSQVYEKFFSEAFLDTFLPPVMVKATAYYTSYIELVGGFFLLIGLLRSYALYALASVLIIVTFGHGLIEPIWNLQHVIFRTILLLPLLFLPKEWDKWSMDNIFKNRTGYFNPMKKQD